MIDKLTCTGCGTCVLRCSMKAIHMESDDEGFSYPSIDDTKCVHCGICDNVCHLNVHFENTTYPKVYAAVNKNVNTLLKSSSGGIFGAVAEYFLRHQGVCYGVTLDGLDPRYVRVQDKDELSKLYGSKYVQADNSGTYRLVEKDCKDGKNVLFVGTPCLVSGLKRYLGRDYENLYTIDIVCHGVPSKMYFEKYIEYIEGKLHGQVFDFSFRDKGKYGVGCISSCRIDKRNGRKKIAFTSQTLNYYYFYMFADSYRESCYYCKYTDLNRVSDVTLGDFWGIEKLNSELDVRHGCSAVLINSLKGDFLLHNAIREQCILEEHTIQEVLVRNTALQKNTIRPATRDTLYSELVESGFEKMLTTRYKPSMLQYIKGHIKGLLPASIQYLIHRYQ